MEEDWISDLPDHVLEHILSFLTLKEAVRAHSLSKRWRSMNVCSILSNLNFSDWFFQGAITRMNSNIRRKNRRLMSVMDKILLERSQKSSPGIEKLFLEFPDDQNYLGLTCRSLEIKLERWMKCVAKPGLIELSLLMLFTSGRNYDFPLATFAAVQSLEKLALMGFRLTSLSHGDNVRFSSLRSLSLWGVTLDNDVMQKLLKHIPLLEKLEVDSCYGLKVLEATQQQLKRVIVRVNKGLKKVVINAPKLEFLELSPPKEAILVETCLLCLREIKFEESWSYKLKTLIEFGGLKLPIDAWFSKFLPLCPLLEQLSIYTCPILHSINVPTALQALKQLRLTTLENMVNVNIIAPNLEKFYITAYSNLPVVELAASNKLEVEIKFHLAVEWGDLWHERLATFLGYFSQCKAVNLCFQADMGFIPKEKRKNLLFRLYGAKSLEITTCKVNKRRFLKYVDYMLWLSPQPTNLKIITNDPFRYNYPYYEKATEMVLEFVYDEETAGKSASCACCELLPIMCWRHCLKEVKIQEFVGDEAEKASLKSWLWGEVEDLRITEVSFNPNSIYGGKYTFYDHLINKTVFLPL